jgi:hypothetical protein
LWWAASRPSPSTTRCGLLGLLALVCCGWGAGVAAVAWACPWALLGLPGLAGRPRRARWRPLCATPPYKGAPPRTKPCRRVQTQVIASFEDDKGLYNQADAGGFIKLQALRLRTLGVNRHKMGM